MQRVEATSSRGSNDAANAELAWLQVCVDPLMDHLRRAAAPGRLDEARLREVDSTPRPHSDP